MRAEVEAIAKTESSPGVLLASGYIAGGTLGGVVIAFLEFAPRLKEKLDYAKDVKDTLLDTNRVAFLIFSVLIVLLALVGAEKLLKSRPEDEIAHDPNESPNLKE
jgi:hypothetical protein